MSRVLDKTQSHCLIEDYIVQYVSFVCEATCIYMYNLSLCAVLQAGILSRSVKLMAKTNTVTTILKLLSIVFIVVVGIAGVIRRGEGCMLLLHSAVWGIKARQLYLG